MEWRYGPVRGYISAKFYFYLTLFLFIKLDLEPSSVPRVTVSSRFM